MRLRTRLALALYRLIDRLDPDAWRSLPMPQAPLLTAKLSDQELQEFVRGFDVLRPASVVDTNMEFVSDVRPRSTAYGRKLRAAK